MIGFLGLGHMGGAVLSGMLQSGQFAPDDILVCDHHSDEKQHLYPVRFVSQDELFDQVDHLILAIKPQAFFAMEEAIPPTFQHKHVISFLAGTPADRLTQAFHTPRITLAMPNVPAQIGAGLTGLYFAEETLEADRDLATRIFSSVGEIAMLQADELDLFSTIAGASLAYLMVYMEAMVDAAVKFGMKKERALPFIAHAMKGAAQLALVGDQSLDDLKWTITSPKGTTIEGVLALEREGFRHAVIQAVTASTEKAMNLKAE